MAVFKRLVCFCFSLSIVLGYAILSILFHSAGESVKNAVYLIGISNVTFSFSWGVMYFVVAVLLGEALSNYSRQIIFILFAIGALGILVQAAIFLWRLNLLAAVALLIIVTGYVYIAIHFFKKGFICSLLSVFAALFHFAFFILVVLLTLNF